MTTATHDDTTFDPGWLRGLCDRAQAWVAETGGLEGFFSGEGRRGGPKAVPVRVPTDAYIDLLFSFGLAALGEPESSRHLLRRAESVLAAETDEVHRWLLPAFRYRITESLDGKPHRGVLPREMLESLEQLPMMSRYAVDRIRDSSSILEPDVRPDPFRYWGARLDPMQTELVTITECLPPAEIASRIENSLVAATTFSTRRDGPVKMRVAVLTKGLSLAAIVGAEFARALLQEVPAAYEELVDKGQGSDWEGGVRLLREALNVTKYINHEEIVLFAVNRVGRFLETSNVAAAASLAEPCLRQLRKDNRRAELASLCERLAGSVPRDNFDVWLPVVASWAYLGQPERAEEVLEKARGLVFGGRQKKPPDTRFPVGKLYVAAVALQPGDIARGRLEELFDRMQDVRDTFNTARYFALNHFRVIDAVILAVVERCDPTPLRVGS